MRQSTAFRYLSLTRTNMLSPDSFAISPTHWICYGAILTAAPMARGPLLSVAGSVAASRRQIQEPQRTVPLLVLFLSSIILVWGAQQSEQVHIACQDTVFCLRRLLPDHPSDFIKAFLQPDLFERDLLNLACNDAGYEESEDVCIRRSPDNGVQNMRLDYTPI